MVGWYDWDKFNSRVKAYWLYSWCCTDTQVGVQSIWIDDELVAYTQQAARKSDYEVYYLSKKAALKMKDVLVSCMEDEEDEYPIADTDVLDNHEPDLFYVDYPSELFQDNYEGFVDGRACKVIATNDNNYNYNLTVEFEDGTQLTVKCREYWTKRNIK